MDRANQTLVTKAFIKRMFRERGSFDLSSFTLWLTGATSVERPEVSIISRMFKDAQKTAEGDLRALGHRMEDGWQAYLKWAKDNGHVSTITGGKLNPKKMFSPILE